MAIHAYIPPFLPLSPPPSILRSCRPPFCSYLALGTPPSVGFIHRDAQHTYTDTHTQPSENNNDNNNNKSNKKREGD